MKRKPCTIASSKSKIKLGKIVDHDNSKKIILCNFTYCNFIGFQNHSCRNFLKELNFSIV